jgi:hypothetical protein
VKSFIYTLLCVSLCGCASQIVAPERLIPEQNDFKGETQSSESGGLRFSFFEGRAADGRVLKISSQIGVSADSASVYIRDRAAQIESIYDPHPDPYFAIISKKTVCPKDYVPKIESGFATEKRIRRFFTNDRLTYGACSQDLARYRADVDLIYCPDSQTLHIVERFRPLELKGSEPEPARCP